MLTMGSGPRRGGSAVPTFRVTYTPYVGARRLLLEDVVADRHDLRGSWHVFAEVQLVCGMPRWICKLRAPAAEVIDVRACR